MTELTPAPEQLIDTAPLAARLVENAVVNPTIRIASRPGKLLMGVFDGEGSYVEGTVLNRRSGEQGEPVPPGLFPDIVDAETPEAIYAGPLYVHFGHFLIESLARAWYAKRHPDLPLVWAGQHDWQDEVLLPWQLEILDVLGLANPTRIIADPTRFARLHVPDIGYRYDDWFHPEHAAFLARYDGPAQEPADRLWLSRSRLESDARDMFAGPTERHLAEAGWRIIHPESLGVREQLDHLARASVVAGEEGSAFHLLMLLKDVSGKKFHILRRHGAEHRNMHTVGTARDVDQTFHTLEREHIIQAEGRVVSKVNPDSAETLDVLQVPLPRRASTPTRADETTIQAIERLAPATLLDVGSRTPAVVVAASAERRVLVTPVLDDDPRAHADSGVEFFELDLATYLEHFYADERFDVIRLGGDTFGEVMAAFRGTKRLGHTRTTWVLGSGGVAARAAVAVRDWHPAFDARRILVGRTMVYVARRNPERRRGEGAVANLADREVAKRVRWMPILRARPDEESSTGAPSA